MLITDITTFTRNTKFLFPLPQMIPDIILYLSRQDNHMVCINHPLHHLRQFCRDPMNSHTQPPTYPISNAANCGFSFTQYRIREGSKTNIKHWLQKHQVCLIGCFATKLCHIMSHLFMICASHLLTKIERLGFYIVLWLHIELSFLFLNVSLSEDI